MPKKPNLHLTVGPRAHGFTLIEVGLIVAIIAMMMLIIVGSILAHRKPVASPAPAPRPELITPGLKSTPAPAPAPSETSDLPPATSTAEPPVPVPPPATPLPLPKLR